MRSAIGGTVASLTELVTHQDAEGKMVVSTQGPTRLDLHNEPQADLLLARPRTDRYRDRHSTTTDALPSIEVAEPRKIRPTQTRTWP
jgi:hypothetical protein